MRYALAVKLRAFASLVCVCVYVRVCVHPVNEQENDMGAQRGNGRLFFVSRRFASRIHEISDLKKALVLSPSAGYTRLRDQKKHTEHDRNAKR